MCVCEGKKSACGVCAKCMCSVYVRVKGEHTEVCVRVQGKKSTQEKSREHRRECRVCAASSCERMSEEEEKRERERTENEKEERALKNCLSACTQKGVCVCLLCTFQISLHPVEHSDPVLRLDPDRLMVVL